MERFLRTISPLAPRFAGVLATVVFSLCGCARLPGGNLQQLRSSAQVRVALIRGFLDWYSTGIDQLAAQLQAAGISAVVYRDDQWHAVLKQLTLSADCKPIILIGYSYGADDVISIARAMNDVHRPVKLLITIDPVTPGCVPPNVACCINYYESNGLWDLLPWLRGIPLSACGRLPVIQNINIRDRPKLLRPNTSHATIAGNPRIHADIVGEVEAVIGNGAR